MVSDTQKTDAPGPMAGSGLTAEEFIDHCDELAKRSVFSSDAYDPDLHRGPATIYNPAGRGNVPVILAAERRAEVERLWLSGHNAHAIARQMGIDYNTVRKDLAFIKHFLSKRKDSEQLRNAGVNTMLEIAAIANARYKADGNTVEGRLAIDAWNRIAKMCGLEDSEADVEVSGAVAKLMTSLANRLSSDQEESSEFDSS